MPNRKTELIKKLKVAFPGKTPMKYKLLLHTIYHHCGELVLVRHYGCKMVYLDPSNPGAAFADVQTNPATKRLLRENLRVKLGGFAAALTGLGEPEIKGDIHPDKYSKAIAQLLSPAEWEEELKWAQEDAWRLFHTPEVWKQVEEMVDDWIGRPGMIRERFGVLGL